MKLKNRVIKKERNKTEKQRRRKDQIKTKILQKRKKNKIKKP